jgi:membrane protease YdiL (CAAX protease family)
MDIICQALVFLLIIKDIKGNRDPEFKLNYLGTFNLKLLSTLLLITVGYFFWYHSSIGIWAEKIPVGKLITDYINTLWMDYKRNPFPLLSSVVVVAPVFEELFFRGILLKGFLARYKPYQAILLSAIFFGLFHLNGPQFVNAFLIGLFLGTIYFKTNSLILCITIHAVHNSVVFLFDNSEFSLGFFGFFMGLTLFFIGLCFIWKFDMLNSIVLSPPKASELLVPENLSYKT